MQSFLINLLSQVNKTLAIYVIGIISFVVSYFSLMSYWHFSFITQVSGLLLLAIFMGGILFYKRYRESVSGKLLALGIIKSTGGSTLEKVQDERIRMRMLEAINALKTSSLAGAKRGSAALYSLPWFMVIGPPANGKSTFLRNSGLNFPFSIDKKNNYKIQGIGGTRDYDWWFSDQAVFLDTAGRYTQCSSESDQKEWFSFLSTVKKARSKAPLNGIIITFGLTDLLMASNEEREQMVLNISKRVQELYTQLGHLIPVYFVFSKTDRVEGFNVFFESLTDKEKQQIWGVNLSDYLQQESLADYLEQRFEALIQQLIRSSFSKMAVSRDPEKKKSIFDFPYQFKAAIGPVQKLLKTFTEHNPYEESIRIMGAYFISSTQAEGELVKKCFDLSTQSSSQTFITKTDDALEHPENKATLANTYFTKDLFEKLLFKYKDAFSANKKTARHLKRVKYFSMVGGVSALLTLFMFYGLSLKENTSLIMEGEQYIKGLIDVSKLSPLSHERLEMVKGGIEHFQKLSTYKDVLPFYLRLGLYRGEEQRKTLGRLIDKDWQISVLKPMNQSLVKQLVIYAKEWRDADPKARMLLRGNYYSTLKAYMMLAYPEYLEVNFASRLITPLWHQEVRQTEHDKEMQSGSYRDFVRYYLNLFKNQGSKRPSVRPNIALINHARHQLYSPTNASNLYALIRTRGLDELQSSTVSQLLNDYGLELIESARKLPQFYTVGGWQNYVSPQIEKIVQGASEVDWVIDVPLHQLSKKQAYKAINAALVTKFRGQMIDLYLSEYADAWLKFLSSIHIQQFTSLDDAASQFRVLYQSQGPIIQLFEKLKENMTITDLIDVKYTSLPVQKTFKSMQALAQVKGNMLESYVKELAAIQSDLERMTGSPDIARDALDYGQAILSNKRSSVELQKAARLVDKLLGDVESLSIRKLLKPLLLSPIQEAWRVVLLEAKRGLEQHWEDEVFHTYQSELRNKFPFAPNKEEASESDVVEFFRKGDGILWGFIHDKLMAFVDERDGKFSNKEWLGIGLDLSQPFLNALGFSKQISEGLFKGDKFGFNFEIYPIPTLGLKEILFESGSKYFRYQNGPQEWVKFVWPGENSGDGALLRLSPAARQSTLTLEYSDTWGVLRLLQKAKLTQVDKAKFKATWHLKAGDGQVYSVSMFVRGNGRNSVLNALLFEQKSLPRHLFSSNKEELA